MANIQIPKMTAKPPEMLQLSLPQFRGMVVSVNNTQLEKNQTPDSMNIELDDRGAIDKRTGWKKINDTIGLGAVNGVFEYKKLTGNIRLLAHTTKLYTWDEGGTTTLIHTGITDARVRAFTFNDKLYIKTIDDYLEYDGTTVKAVTSFAKIPTVTIGTPPTGGGTVFEDFNLIQPGFTQSFSGDGAAVLYQLIQDGLDATAVVAVVDGVTLTEGVDFTVNRILGQVTFNVAPSLNPDNTLITAYKTIAGQADKVLKCTFFAIFGGTNDTRVFMSGNPDLINNDYRSGLYDPTYFPEGGFSRVGSDEDPITGYAKQYGNLVIFKRREIWLRSFSESGGEVLFPTRRLNENIGCVATDSIQTVESLPHFLSAKGVYRLVNQETNNELNVEPISDDIDTSNNTISIQGLIDRGELDHYISVDFEQKYMLFNPVLEIAWIYDYRYRAWYLWDTQYFNSVINIDERLYFGSNANGIIYKKFLITDSNAYSDDGQAIDAYWRSKIFSLDTSSNLKLVDKIFFTLKPAALTSATMKVRSNLQSNFEEVVVKAVSLMFYSSVIYSNWTYGASVFPEPTRSKVRLKKISYFQIELRNNVAFESMGILSLDIKYSIQREVKR